MEKQKLANGFRVDDLIKQIKEKRVDVDDAFGATPCLIFRPNSKDASPLFYSNNRLSSSEVFKFSETGKLDAEESRVHGYLDPAAIVVPLWKSSRNALKHLISLGRSSTSDIRINSPRVSKTHAFISKDDQGRWQILDNYSTNGTYVDEVLLEPAVPHYLSVGAEIKLGVIYAVFLDGSGIQQLCDVYEDLGKGSTQRIRKKPACSQCGDSHKDKICRNNMLETQELNTYPG